VLGLGRVGSLIVTFLDCFHFFYFLFQRVHLDIHAAAKFEHFAPTVHVARRPPIVYLTFAVRLVKKLRVSVGGASRAVTAGVSARPVLQYRVMVAPTNPD
jgi:hypothetical protein